MRVDAAEKSVDYALNKTTKLGFKSQFYVLMKSNMASEELLKPFYQRAIEAEERLSRLEAVLAGNKDAGNQELSQLISELQAKLEAANAEALSEREKAKQLAMENEKLKYRIAHLVQAVKESDQKLVCMRGHVLEATAETSSKLETMRL